MRSSVLGLFGRWYIGHRLQVSAPASVCALPGRSCFSAFPPCCTNSTCHSWSRCPRAGCPFHGLSLLLLLHLRSSLPPGLIHAGGWIPTSGTLCAKFSSITIPCCSGLSRHVSGICQPCLWLMLPWSGFPDFRMVILLPVHFRTPVCMIGTWCGVGLVKLLYGAR